MALHLHAAPKARSLPRCRSALPYVLACRCAAALAMALCSQAIPAEAAQASAGSVEKLLSANGAQKSLAQAVAAYETQIRQQVLAGMVQANGGGPLTSQQQQAVDKAIPGVVAVLREEMGWDKLKVHLIRIYQGQLTQAEVDRLIQLYQDPAYVRAMEKMQAINLQTTRLLLEQMPHIANRMQPVLEQAVKP